MISADDFILPAQEKGYDFYTGVPCSFLVPFINRIISSKSIDYIGAASEGEAVAIASGAWLAGRKTVVMCQNSGLGNCVNPFTSLNYPFLIPTLLITTWRGEPGLNDEPQHELMGNITQSLMELMHIQSTIFPREASEIQDILKVAEATIKKTNLPFGLIMKKDSVKPEFLDQPVEKIEPRGTYENLQSGTIETRRYKLLEEVVKQASSQVAIIATTGKCSRELFTIADRPQHIYQVGSMGGASGMGLGVALNTDKQVVILDGDGAALMKMGNFATIGANAPKNLIHVIMDNGVHDSTGGQTTASAHTDFAEIALACGYRFAATTDDLKGFTQVFSRARNANGPTLIHAKIKVGSIKNLGRPTLRPENVARRFQTFILNG